jgi:hypothetical protein
MGHKAQVEEQWVPNTWSLYTIVFLFDHFGTTVFPNFEFRNHMISRVQL